MLLRKTPPKILERIKKNLRRINEKLSRRNRRTTRTIMPIIVLPRGIKLKEKVVDGIKVNPDKSGVTTLDLGNVFENAKGKLVSFRVGPEFKKNPSVQVQVKKTMEGDREGYELIIRHSKTLTTLAIYRLETS